jgi:Nif-specific regulatory protein
MTPIYSRTPVDYLRDISAWVSSVQNLDQLLELIIKTAARMMQAQASSLMLVNDDGKKLFFEVATGLKKEEIKKIELRVGQGIAGHVAKTGEPLFVKDVKTDPRWYDKVSKDTGFETYSIVCSPMKPETKVIGVVQVINRIDKTPFNEEDLQILNVFADVAAKAICDARRMEQLNRENLDLKELAGKRYKIVGNSKGLKKAISDALKVADSKASVMILGESGTGKELMAHMIHKQSPRKDGDLIVLNCGALTETLLEDELFGHEKGAYTGAVSKKMGKFEMADKSTLFLDEIGEMSLNMQTRLLRILQEGTYYRVGGSKSVSVDVRIICATNRDIEKEVKQGRFREDLYYRLNVVQISLPPLRDRREDVLELAEHFLEQFKIEKGRPDLHFSKDAIGLLMKHCWSGNVRELKNAVERAVIMGDGNLIVPKDLPFSENLTRSLAVAGVADPVRPGKTLKQAVNKFKKELILSTLDSVGGNRTRAAQILGIQRTYLSRLITEYGLRA